MVINSVNDLSRYIDKGTYDTESPWDEVLSVATHEITKYTNVPQYKTDWTEFLNSINIPDIIKEVDANVTKIKKTVRDRTNNEWLRQAAEELSGFLEKMETTDFLPLSVKSIRQIRTYLQDLDNLNNSQEFIDLQGKKWIANITWRIRREDDIPELSTILMVLELSRPDDFWEYTVNVAGQGLRPWKKAYVHRPLAENETNA